MDLPQPVTKLRTQDQSDNIMEVVLAKGDLSQLTPSERNSYYLKVCETVGLNPLTRPLEYITLSGRMVLYARRDATDQLRSIHKVSITDMLESEIDGVYIVTVKASNGDGRTDMAKGAVNVNGLKGEALANALMKAETKAKRRATLSLCGLGLLDETEAHEVAASEKPKTLPKKDSKHIYEKLQEEIRAANSRDMLKAWGEANKERIAVLPEDWQDILRLQYEEQMADLRAQEES